MREVEVMVEEEERKREMCPCESKSIVDEHDTPQAVRLEDPGSHPIQETRIGHL